MEAFDGVGAGRGIDLGERLQELFDGAAVESLHGIVRGGEVPVRGGHADARLGGQFRYRKADPTGAQQIADRVHQQHSAALGIAAGVHGHASILTDAVRHRSG